MLLLTSPREFGSVQTYALISFVNIHRRKRLSELRKQGEDIHHQMCQMYSVFKDVANSHGKRSAIKDRFVDALSCDSEDCYDTMDWKALEHQQGCESVDSGYRSDYPSLSDVISCPSYPKKPKILMGTRLIGWQRSRDNSSVLQHHQQLSNEVNSSRPSNIKEECTDEITKEDRCILSPPLRIVRFSDNVKTSKCKRIVPKYKKNRLSLKGTPARCESFDSGCCEDPTSHSYGKIVYYDLDRVDFLNTSLEESRDIKKLEKSFKRPSQKDASYYPQAVDNGDNGQRKRSPNQVPTFKKPITVKTIPNYRYKRTSTVDINQANVVPTQHKNVGLHSNGYDPRKVETAEVSHIYEEIIYDTSPKNEDRKTPVPPLPQRPKEFPKCAVSPSRDGSTKYRRRSNMLSSVSNKMGKLSISSSQVK